MKRPLAFALSLLLAASSFDAIGALRIGLLKCIADKAVGYRDTVARESVATYRSFKAGVKFRDGSGAFASPEDAALSRVLEAYLQAGLVSVERGRGIVFKTTAEISEHSLYWIGLGREWKPSSKPLELLTKAEQAELFKRITSSARLTISRRHSESEMPFELDVDPAQLVDGKLPGLRDDVNAVVEITRVLHARGMSGLDEQMAYIALIEGLVHETLQEPGRWRVVVAAHTDAHRRLFTSFGFKLRVELRDRETGGPIYVLESDPETMRQAFNQISQRLVDRELSARERGTRVVERPRRLRRASALFGHRLLDPTGSGAGLNLAARVTSDGKRIALSVRREGIAQKGASATQTRLRGTFKVLSEPLWIDTGPSSVAVDVVRVRLQGRFKSGPVRDYDLTVHLPIFSGALLVERTYAIPPEGPVPANWKPFDYWSVTLQKKGTPSSYQTREHTTLQARYVEELLVVKVDGLLVMNGKLISDGNTSSDLRWKTQLAYPTQLKVDGRSLGTTRGDVPQSPVFDLAPWHPSESALDLVDALNIDKSREIQLGEAPFLRGPRALQEIRRRVDGQPDFRSVFRALGLTEEP